MAEDNPRVDVLVLNYNGLEHLPVCLKSLILQTYNNYRIILVDNGSIDKSIEYTKENFPQVKIIHSEKNLGTTSGFNFGARHAEGEYLLFLANDLEAEPNLIEELVKEIQKDSRIAICSGKMMKFDRRDIIDYNGFKIDVFAFPYAPGHNEKDTGQGQELIDVVPTGTVLLIKRNVFQEVGGYDDSFFALGDEIDLWWRIRLVGYRSVINHNAVVYHKAAVTFRKFKRARLRFYSEKNSLRILLKNYSLSTLIFILPLYFIFFISEALFYIFILRADMLRAVLEALIWNLNNLKDTLSQRRIIQSKRKINDRQLLRDFLFKSLKLEIFFEILSGKATV